MAESARNMPPNTNAVVTRSAGAPPSVGMGLSTVSCVLAWCLSLRPAKRPAGDAVSLSRLGNRGTWATTTRIADFTEARNTQPATAADDRLNVLSRVSFVLAPLTALTCG